MLPQICLTIVQCDKLRVNQFSGKKKKKREKERKIVKMKKKKKKKATVFFATDVSDSNWRWEKSEKLITRGLNKTVVALLLCCTLLNIPINHLKEVPHYPIVVKSSLEGDLSSQSIYIFLFHKCSFLKRPLHWRVKFLYVLVGRGRCMFWLLSFFL